MIRLRFLLATGRARTSIRSWPARGVDSVVGKPYRIRDLEAALRVVHRLLRPKEHPCSPPPDARAIGVAGAPASGGAMTRRREAPRAARTRRFRHPANWVVLLDLGHRTGRVATDDGKVIAVRCASATLDVA